MRRVMARGRQVGKSTLSLADQMLQHQSQLMHRIAANDEVRKWLDTEHSQYGVSNPEWWKFEKQINITDKLFTLLVLRFAE